MNGKQLKPLWARWISSVDTQTSSLCLADLTASIQPAKCWVNSFLNHASNFSQWDEGVVLKWCNKNMKYHIYGIFVLGKIHETHHFFLSSIGQHLSTESCYSENATSPVRAVSSTRSFHALKHEWSAQPHNRGTETQMFFVQNGLPNRTMIQGACSPWDRPDLRWMTCHIWVCLQVWT